jgi:hypothetical protein
VAGAAVSLRQLLETLVVQAVVAVAEVLLVLVAQPPLLVKVMLAENRKYKQIHNGVAVAVAVLVLLEQARLKTMVVWTVV